MTLSGIISGTGGVVNNNSGLLTLSGNNSYSGGFTLNAGSVQVSAGTYTGFGTGTLTINGGTIRGVNASFTTTNNSVWNASFTADRGTTGVTTWNHNGNITLGGNVTVNSPANGWTTIVNGAIGETGGARNLLTTGNTLTFTLNGTNTYSGNTSIGSSTLTIGGAGQLGSGSYAGNITNTGGFVYSSSANQTLSGNISGASTLTKNTSSSSILTLSGVNSYNGATTVTLGTLAVNGNNAPAKGAVSVAAGGTLAGVGTIGGAVTVSANGKLSPQDGNANPGTLTLTNGLTLNGGNLTFVITNATAGAHSRMTINSGTFTVTGVNKIQLIAATNQIPAGTYVLITNNVARTPSANQFVFAQTGTTNWILGAATLTLTNGANSVILAVSSTAVMPTSPLYWQGSVNGIWDTSSFNWSSVPTYTDGTAVVFDDTASVFTVANGAGFSPNPASVTVTNTTAYTISAPIQGSGGLTKAGSGTLTLSGINSYSGGTIINGTGNIAFTTDANFGATSGGITFNSTGGLSYADLTVLNVGRTFTINPGAALNLGANLTVNGIFAGSGTLNPNSADSFIFTNPNNTFTGIINSSTAGNTGYGLEMASIGDTAGAGLINLVGGQGTFRWTSASGSATTLTNRQFAISTGTGAGIISALGTSGSTLVINKDLAISGTASVRTLRLMGSNTGNNTFAGKIVDGTAGGASVVSLTKEEAGTWVLSGTNTYTGPTTNSGGILSINSITNVGGGASAVGAPINAAGGTIEIGSGATSAQLNYTGTATETDRVINLAGTTGNATLNQIGTGLLKFTSAFTATGAGAKSLALAGNTTGTGEIAGAIVNNTTANFTALVKNGSSTWTLSGPNTYSGATTINTGTLRFNGNSAAVTNRVTVNAGATLGGTGTIGGTVTNLAGSTLAPGGGNGIAGTLTLTNGLGLNGAYLSFILTNSNPGEYSQVAVTGGSMAVSGVNYIQLTAATNQIPDGAYTLMTNATTRSGTGSIVFYQTGTTNWTLANGATLTIINGANSVVLAVSGGPAALVSPTMKWQGNLSGTWDTATLNWTNSASSTNYSEGVNVIFDDLASIFTVTNVSGYSPNPGSVTFNITNNNYNLVVPLKGFGDVTKNGSGRLTFTNSLGSGLLTLNGGTLSNNATATLSNSTINLAGNSTVANATNLTVNGPITSSGSLTKTGAGTLTLSGNNTYTGDTTISAGTLQLSTGVTGGASTLASASITLSQGATLFFTPSVSGSQSVAAPITLSGGAGTASIKLGLNDKGVTLSGGVTGQASVAQILAITQGAVAGGGSGDRENITFTGDIANGGSGGTLGVTIDFAGGSGTAQNAFVNLQGQNTFTGSLTVTNTKGLIAGATYPGAWVTIGGERRGISSAWGQTAGTGFLGAGADYSGNISIFNGAGLTTLSFLNSSSLVDQFLRGTISGTGSLRQDGAGTLTLSGTNTYSGTTTVSAGTLLVNGNSAAVTNVVTVATNATFGGTNTVGGVVNYQNGSRALFTVTPTAATAYSNTTYMTFTNAAFLTNVTVKVNLGSSLGNGTYVLATNYVSFTTNGTLTFATNSGSLGSGGVGSVSVAGNNLILTVSGVVSANTAPVAFAKSFSVAQGGAVTIAITNGAKILATDADGDPLTFVSLGSPDPLALGTAVINGGSTNFTYTNTNGVAGTNDMFSFIVTDGTAFATNLITIQIDSAVGANLVSATHSNSVAYLVYSGIPGTNYVSQRTTNLAPPITWTSVATNTAGAIAGPTPGMIFFTNTIVPPTSFFRTAPLP